MKKFFIAVALLASLFTQANDSKPISKTIRESFNTDFKGNQEARWAYLPEWEVFQVNFQVNEGTLTAYYDDGGQLLATVRNIEKDMLPLTVNLQLNKKYSAMRMVHAAEWTIDGEICYFLTMTGDKGAMILEANSLGSLSVHKKARKQN